MDTITHKRLNDAQRGAICEAYKSGKKAADIAKFFSVSQATVYSIIKAGGVDLQCPQKAVRRPITEETAIVTAETVPDTTGDLMDMLNKIGVAILLVREELKTLNAQL